MSTLGTSFYVDSRILPEQEDMMAPRYPAAAAGVEQALCEYGGQETLQGKSSIFGGSWSSVAAPSAAAPTYIHQYSSGDCDGVFARSSWALEPVSASLCLAGIPHYDVKPEPLSSGADCATLETHTPLLSDIESGAEIQSSPASGAAEEPQAAEKTDPSEFVSPGNHGRSYCLIPNSIKDYI